MYMGAEDSYCFFGRWLNGMMCIDEDCSLVNIVREDDVEDYGISMVGNIESTVSSRDARDYNLYDVSSEERLVYYKERSDVKFVVTDEVRGTKKAVATNTKITLVFCEASRGLEECVVDAIIRDGAMNGNAVEAENISVEYTDTFLLSDDDAELMLDELECA